MATDVLMPQLGESIAEGTIIRWNKKVGDSVDRDEPLFEVSTDKVDAEVPSPAAGVVTEIRVAEGETVPVDSVIAQIGQPGEVSGDATPRPSEPVTAERPLDAVDGSRRQPGPPRPPESRAQRLSPVVRKLAREHNVDLSAIRGTGAGGRVTKADVLDAVGKPGAERVQVEPMTIMRRRIAEHMVSSRRISAHVHTVFDVDFSHVVGLREKRRSHYEEAEAKLSFLVFVAKAAVEALQEVPIVNTSLQGDSIVYRHDVNLGVAVALDGGLIVPVVKQAHTKTVLELARALGDLSERARTKHLRPEDVEGGTFTITNPGGFGSILGMPIINQPQVAILCMGSVEPRAAVAGGQVVVQTRAFLTLGFDHRVIDGAVADHFMSVVKRHLEQFDENLL